MAETIAFYNTSTTSTTMDPKRKNTKDTKEEKKKAEEERQGKEVTKVKLLNLLILFIFCSCSQSKMDNRKKEAGYGIKVIYNSKLVKNPSFYIDTKSNSFETTLKFYKKIKPIIRIRKFKKLGNIFVEEKALNNFDSDSIDTVYVPYFLMKDTIFENYTNGGTLPKGWDDWRHEVKVVNENEFKLTKTLIVDAGFKEEYFYDSNFRISRVNIYQGGDTVMFGN